MEQFVVDRLRESLHDRVTTAGPTPDYDAARTTFNAHGPAATRGHRPGPRRRRRRRGGRRGQRPRPPDRGPRRRTQRRGPRDGRSGPGRRPARSTRRHGRSERPGSFASPAARCWEDVDGAAWRHHLAVVGGTFGDTGVGGLTLGGGIGWLSAHPGLHLRQPRPRRGRDRGRREGRGRSRRRPGPALGIARRRRQLRRGHDASSSRRSTRSDPGRLHPTTR